MDAWAFSTKTMNLSLGERGRTFLGRARRRAVFVSVVLVVEESVSPMGPEVSLELWGMGRSIIYERAISEGEEGSLMPTRARKKKYMRPFSRIEEGVEWEFSSTALAEGGTRLPVPSGVAFLSVSFCLPELALADIRVSKPFFLGSSALESPFVTVSSCFSAGALSGLLTSAAASFSVAASPLPAASSPVVPLPFCSASASASVVLTSLSSFLVSSIASCISTSLASLLSFTSGIASSIVVCCSLPCAFLPFFAFPAAPPSALRLLPVAGEGLLCDALGGLGLVFCAA